MEKLKLIEARKNKGYSQEYVATQLCLDESNYCRRERGQLRISSAEWDKLSQILGVSIDDIYESDEKQFFTCTDNATGNWMGNHNTVYSSVPEFMLETQQKYIQKIEEENHYLKELLKQSKK